MKRGREIQMNEGAYRNVAKPYESTQTLNVIYMLKKPIASVFTKNRSIRLNYKNILIYCCDFV